MTRWRLFSREPKEEDLNDEIQAHLAMAKRDLVDRGKTPDLAAAEARREFGNIGLVKETTREIDRSRFFEALSQDLRYAFRSLKSSRVFAVVAISSLALGIGANTAIFSFVNALLLNRLPVPEPERLVQLEEDEKGKTLNTVFSFPFLSELDQRNGAFDGISGRYPVRVNLATDHSAEPLEGEVVTGNYFKTLRVKAALGRLINDDDIYAAAGNPVCVISYSTWQDRFSGDPQIIGRKLMLNAHPYTVIGVTEKGFFRPQLQSRIEMQMPVSRMSDFMGGFFGSDGGITWKSAGFSWLEPLARLKPGISLTRAQAMINPLARSIQLELAPVYERAKVAGATRAYRLTDGSQGANYNSMYSKPVVVLMAVVGLVPLIACANLANLLLARANARTKECAVRLSLGASRWRLLRQSMVESMLLAVCGGAMGLALAVWIVHTLLLFLNAGREAAGALHVSLDPTVISFSILLATFTAFLFGLGPAWQSTRPDVLPELKGASVLSRKTVSGFQIRQLLIVFQIALAVVILFAAGLLTRTLSKLRTIDLGFNPSRVVTLEMDPAMNGYPHAQTDQIFDDILNRLRAQPGIAAASLAVVPPVEGGMISLAFDVPGHVAKDSDLQTNFNMISPDYFKTLNQGFLAGRDFTNSDRMKSPRVAIVNQKFAEQYFAGLNPVGRHFKVVNSDTEIVGLVKNSRYQTLRENTWPLVYLPVKQTQSSGYTLLVRTRSQSRESLANIESTIHSAYPRLPVYDAIELREQIDQNIAAERVLSFLSTLFSLLATLLCCIGIYGLMAYAVTRRTREIGIRIAIGAEKSDVARLFLREGAMLLAAGILIGVPLAVISARVLTSILYAVSPEDPVTLVMTVLIFAIAGLLATAIPVMRAARVEPLRALRYE